ncbi:tumor necrosis factor receptor superfamily member 14 [Oncorhynchus kisutch]|uniref:tumor necrosis factor receptor superfamily member 14 n=1 Tax=Oncorhynchus kisutch TaxID=8019 RepID=UPI00099F4FA2|nr:tumor necrosis factor receptor superfamily member 14-like [Oncorhynchus kisutch]XP_031650565.1 tumor necrosis factor receptor superfamily member 14-like [Oncorhynchus kisutch]
MEQFESFIWTRTIILVLGSIGSCIACGRDEYRIGEECCPMCSPGNHVHKHCTKFTTTSCVSCVAFTFLDEPNGLMKCAPCSSCDSDLGLRVKQPCTSQSDDFCEPQEGSFCWFSNKNGCKIAQKHRSCKPGQYIHHTGTTSTDTVCSDCTGDTYSDGSLAACQSHTGCESLGLQEIKPGSPWSDSECGSLLSHSTARSRIGALAVAIILAGGAFFLIMVRRRSRRNLNSFCC